MRIPAMNPTLACSILLCGAGFALSACLAVPAGPPGYAEPDYEYPYAAPAPYVLITPGWGEEHEEREPHHRHRHHEDHDLF